MIDAKNTYAQLCDLAATFGDDELALMLDVARGIERGRVVYGELQLDRDGRDFEQEAREEIRDCLVYLAALGMQKARRA